jgi:hypothetical protein
VARAGEPFPAFAPLAHYGSLLREGTMHDDAPTIAALWTPWDTPGLEDLRLTVDADGVRADGLIIGVADDGPYRLRYSVRCDTDWRVRETRVVRLDRGVAPIVLRADGAGHWTTGEGEPLPALDRCIDIDLVGSPFTNTLPIRRLGLADGESRDLTMAYIWVPELTVTPDPQRYTRLAADRYLFESRDSDFRAELPLDEHGLVRDYPGLFRRVWPR